MPAEVRCANPDCGRPSRLCADTLGRTFRCGRCGTKLPRTARPEDAAVSVGSWQDPESSDPFPWETEDETAPWSGGGVRARSLGVALPAWLGRFQVRGLLGSGACGTVYRAFDPDLEREVALKVPHPGALTGSEKMARFLGEAKALARLRHPGIVPVFEAGKFGDLPYLATAFIAGRSLAEVLVDGPLALARAVEIAAELGEALGHAHGEGVVHRDVKPGNVLVETGGAVHLADFGLAHRHDAGALTRTGVVVGTPAYIAPEQAACGEELARPESDQYSLGVVLYEMLCGRPPFLGPPPMVLYSARFDDPLPPRCLRPDLPRSLERICLKAMAKDASERYPTCQAFAAELRRWRRRSRRPDRSGSIDRAVRWLRNRPGVAVSTALAALVLAASTAFHSLRP